jgi:uncharacterized UPF0160 family protein
MSIFTKKKILVTHDGTFHADDLFACATLILWCEKKKQPFKIIRTRNENIVKNADIVFDVGGIYDENLNRFDHHQKYNSGARSNGIEYSSFGLIWKKFGPELCSGNAEVWEKIDSKIVAPIDAGDNGIDISVPKFKNIIPYDASQIFLAFSPTWKESRKNISNAFFEQVSYIKKIIEREIKDAMDDEEAKQIIIDAYNKNSDKRIIILENAFQRYLYQSVLSKLQEPIYAVLPSNEGNYWKVEAIIKNPGTYESRKLFPEQWRGFLDNDPKLHEITGVPDAFFSHRVGFLIGTKSKEGAISLAEKALIA